MQIDKFITLHKRYNAFQDVTQHPMNEPVWFGDENKISHKYGGKPLLRVHQEQDYWEFCLDHCRLSTVTALLDIERRYNRWLKRQLVLLEGQGEAFGSRWQVLEGHRKSSERNPALMAKILARLRAARTEYERKSGTRDEKLRVTISPLTAFI